MIRGYSDHAANERTFLAWLRTSIAVIAFGFVVEKLNLFALTMSSASLDETRRFARTGQLLDNSSIHAPGILPDLIFAVIISSLLIALSAYLMLG